MIHMVLLLAAVIFYRILNNEREERERVATPERLPKDRTGAKLFYRILFPVMCATFYLHADWTTGAPVDGSLASRVISAALLFYAMVGVPLWICAEMEHKDFNEQKS